MSSWIESIIPINPFSRPGTKRSLTRNIVWHYTGNPGATAIGHFGYFGTTLVRQDPFDSVPDTYASAHLFLDPTESLLLIPLDEVAYHASQANPYSVGVELCIQDDWTFHPATYERAVQVGVELCRLYGLTPSDFLRHFDVTGKICPKRWVDHPDEWEAFKAEVGRRLKGGVSRMPNWTDSQWADFAGVLNSLYQKSVNNELDRPVLWNYDYVTKAYTHQLTIDETIWLLGIMFAASQRVVI